MAVETEEALTAALRLMARTYELHQQPDAAGRLRSAADQVDAGTAVRAEIHALLGPRALPTVSIYPFDNASRAAFYDAWDAALDLTR